MIISRHPDIDRETGLKFIGYWRGHENPKRWGGMARTPGIELPDPRDYVDLHWSRREQMIVAAYLKNGQPWEQWYGMSWCRFGCDIQRSNMGSQDFTDGVYVWPEGFAHYLEKHDVKPPQEFIDHVLRRR